MEEDDDIVMGATDEYGNEINAAVDNINEPDVEIAENPYEKIEEFKIDENMPEELKKQLERFNKQSSKLNSIMLNGVDVPEDEDIDTDEDEEYDEDYEDDDEGEEIDDSDIKEDDEEIGSLF